MKTKSTRSFKSIRKSIAVLLSVLIVLSSLAGISVSAYGQTYYAKVGQTITVRVELIDSPNTAVVPNSCRWISNDPFNVEILDPTGGSSCRVKINKKPDFSKVMLECSYSYNVYNPMTNVITRVARASAYCYVVVEDTVTPTNPPSPVNPNPTPAPSYTYPTVKNDVNISCKNISSLYIKQAKKLNAVVTNAEGYVLDGTMYKSSNNKIVRVTSTGKVIGVKKGVATITIKNGNVTKSLKIKVKNPSLSKKSVSVKKGKTVSIKIKGKVSGVNNKYKNTKTAKIISKKSASTLKIKGLRKGKTNLKIKVSGITLKLKVKVK